MSEDNKNPTPDSKVMGPVECQTCNGTGKEGRHSICRDCYENPPASQVVGYGLFDEAGKMLAWTDNEGFATATWKPDRVRPLYAGSPPTSQVMGWQPIETAQTDGTSIIGWNGVRAFRCKLMQYYVKYPSDEGGPTYRGVWTADYYDGLVPENPTHWVALPSTSALSAIDDGMDPAAYWQGAYERMAARNVELSAALEAKDSPITLLGGLELCILCGQTHCDVCPLPASNVTVAVNREVLRDIAQLLSGSMFTYISTEEQARARGSELYGLLAAKDSPSSQMVGSDIAALEKQIKDLKHILASAEGRAKAATSNLDYWRGQYEAIAAKGDAWLAELEMAILCSDDHDQNKVLENYRKVLRAVKDKRAADELAVTSISPLLNPPPAAKGSSNG